MMSLTQDQYRFLMANVAGLSLALPFNFIPKSLRNEYHYVPGILMVYYCFGRQANALILFSIMSFAIFRFVPAKHVQRVGLVSSLAFLSYAHLSRQIMDYGSYILDISGPFMIAVQKVTSLGFCLHDGRAKKMETEESEGESGLYEIDNNNNSNETSSDGKLLSPISSDTKLLTDEQRKYAVETVPNFNEFMGYFFHFPSVLCGPIMYFKDYSEFVHAPSNKQVPPGRNMAVAKRLTISMVCTILHLTLSPKFDIEFLRSPDFLIHTPLLLRFYYIVIFTMLSRLKYYVAWHLGEAISNMSGLGFKGFNSEGKPMWDLISNMNLLRFELSLNMRDAIHCWNKSTQSWLRRTAYERVPKKYSTLATYILSAVWHGFYPGYYMTFLGGALFTLAARNGRRIIRPLFQRGKILQAIYDIITFTLTRLTIAYLTFPFVILDFRHNYEIYKSLYFSLHILAFGGMILGWICRK